LDAADLQARLEKAEAAGAKDVINVDLLTSYSVRESFFVSRTRRCKADLIAFILVLDNDAH